ncbi:2-hydroxy-3-keto-5-methylthiopentenyl-1-phosphate phosphatase [Tumebacillus permanentifrigoris]|uniref:2-hydroxy-3-keto-5-methylthiopentenyl-1-phosphate phosphatase n=1 Tax=Tumebacillus permanentifrigoris TaxID=378543 RepID=A0A316D550_9BACL|nr:2-hydroxy-3-keto-5-methylthiopentenyl-1-phosphate phosphatase [Tumebacillus permanentifrigoris]PWK07447.1 2-hydroxy-3-keto-5-methylthiopentenyl-1-phosphate phosphatase [Tumebacillus permanentifrigoris]
MSKRIAIFCDFDGTITERDMIITIMERFGAPGWETTKDQILNQEISIQQGVGTLFHGISTTRRDEVAAYAQEVAAIRAGFPEFLEYCKEQEIDFWVTSGGIDFFVKPLLEPYAIANPIYCNGSDFSGETIRITWPHACDEHCTNGCGMCKPTVLRKFPEEDLFKIVIGDSITDLQAAKRADFVIARSKLLKDCEALGLAHAPFVTFHDVIAVLQQLVKGEVFQ